MELNGKMVFACTLLTGISCNYLNAMFSRTARPTTQAVERGTKRAVDIAFETYRPLASSSSLTFPAARQLSTLRTMQTMKERQQPFGIQRTGYAPLGTIPASQQPMGSIGRRMLSTSQQPKKSWIDWLFGRTGETPPAGLLESTEVLQDRNFHLSQKNIYNRSYQQFKDLLIRAAYDLEKTGKSEYLNRLIFNAIHSADQRASYSLFKIFTKMASMHTTIPVNMIIAEFPRDYQEAMQKNDKNFIQDSGTTKKNYAKAVQEHQTNLELQLNSQAFTNFVNALVQSKQMSDLIMANWEPLFNSGVGRELYIVTHIPSQRVGVKGYDQVTKVPDNIDMSMGLKHSLLNYIITSNSTFNTFKNQIFNKKERSEAGLTLFYPSYQSIGLMVTEDALRDYAKKHRLTPQEFNTELNQFRLFIKTLENNSPS